MLFHLLVLLKSRGVKLEDVEAALATVLNLWDPATIGKSGAGTVSVKQTPTATTTGSGVVA